MLPGTVADVLEGSAGDVADPQGAHELQAGQPAQVVGVPLPELRVGRLLTDDRVVHDRVAEMVDDRGDGERATESIVETCLSHGGYLGCCAGVRVGSNANARYRYSTVPRSQVFC